MTPVAQVTSPSHFFMHELDRSKGHRRGPFHWMRLYLPILISLRRHQPTTTDASVTFSSCDMRVYSVTFFRLFLFILASPSQMFVLLKLMVNLQEARTPVWRQTPSITFATQASPLSSLCLPPSFSLH